MSAYNLRWRNTLIDSVDWPNGENNEKGKILFRFVVEEDKNIFTSKFEIKFDFDLYDTSSDIQFIKMKMDRSMVQWARENLHVGSSDFDRVKSHVFDYVFDILKNPYEWEASLP